MKGAVDTDRNEEVTMSRVRQAESANLVLNRLAQSSYKFSKFSATISFLFSLTAFDYTPVLAGIVSIDTMIADSKSTLLIASPH